MDLLFFIQLLSIFAICFYGAGVAFDFLCELRMRKLYVKKQEASKGVYQKGYSMAVVHAKIFKIEMDYMTMVSLIEKKRKYIRILLGFRERRLLSK